MKLVLKNTSIQNVIFVVGLAIMVLVSTSLPSSMLIYDCLWLFTGVLIIKVFGDRILQKEEK